MQYCTHASNLIPVAIASSLLIYRPTMLFCTFLEKRVVPHLFTGRVSKVIMVKLFAYWLIKVQGQMLCELLSYYWMPLLCVWLVKMWHEIYTTFTLMYMHHSFCFCWLAQAGEKHRKKMRRTQLLLYYEILATVAIIVAVSQSWDFQNTAIVQCSVICTSLHLLIH